MEEVNKQPHNTTPGKNETRNIKGSDQSLFPCMYQGKDEDTHLYTSMTRIDTLIIRPTYFENTVEQVLAYVFNP